MEIKVSLIGRRIDSDNVTDRFWCCRVRFSFSFHGFQPSVHRLTFGPRLLIFKKHLLYPVNTLPLFLKSFFFIILVDICPFMRPLIPLFWTFGDVSSGFQSRIRNWQRHMWCMVPEIYLWCDFCRPVDGQHGGQLLFPTCMFQQR